MKKRIIAFVCAAAFVMPIVYVNAEYKESDLKDAVNKAIEWKDENDSPFYGIGTNSANLYITALKRLGKSYDYNAYLAGMDGIAAGYGAEHNSSDMQRSAMATYCAGGDAQNVGGRDLVADSTYYRDATAPIDKEGVNGYSWALLTLDMNRYETPEWAIKDRNDIIVGILSHQNTDGSFDSGVYETASAITALAPYYDTSGAYTITQNQTGWVMDISPREAIDNALGYLEGAQSRDGDWGDLRSTAMTVIALDAMNIDADTDNRFVAGKGSALDGLMLYQSKNGGFSADLNKSDGEATSYALCALASHLRKMQGKARFFNFSSNDTVTFETSSNTAATATSRPSSSSSSSSSASSSSSSSSRATTRPKTTNRPSSTSRPTSTLKPKKTTTPKSEASPKPSVTPRATKRPALVGPVEMPGPMKPTDPPELSNGADNSMNNGSAAPVIIAVVIAVLALCAAAALAVLKKTGHLKQINIPSVFTSKKKTENKDYRAKTHRKTEQHRKYEEREKYNRRKKFDRRR